MPIQFGTSVAVRLTDTGPVRAASMNDPEPIELRCGAPAALPRGSWGRFVEARSQCSSVKGSSIAGADILVGGDIPGSGLSSSASLTVGLIYALSHAWPIDHWRRCNSRWRRSASNTNTSAFNAA